MKVLHCPNEKDGRHPEPDRNQFVTNALIRIGPNYDVRDVFEYLQLEACCTVCGAMAGSKPPRMPRATHERAPRASPS